MVLHQTTAARPTTATWDLDPSHSRAEFAVRHMMIATVRGSFAIREATLRYDGNEPESASVEAELDATSVDTRSADRDAHLRSPDFFDAAAHPTLRFTSTRVTRIDADTYDVDGQLTIRGVAKPVTLRVERGGEGADPWGNHRIGITATTTIDRREWGLGWNAVLEAGGVLVGDKVKITIDAQFIRRPPA